MTWGSGCPQCGRDDCTWTLGKDCEGQHRRREKPTFKTSLLGLAILCLAALAAGVKPEGE